MADVPETSKNDIDFGDILEESVQNGDFMEKLWKPMTGIVYMAINVYDFILGPMIYHILEYYNSGQSIDAYQSVTLQGGGIMHLSFGAILGISAYKK